MNARERILEHVNRAFRRHGAEHISTPLLERSETLVGPFRESKTEERRDGDGMGEEAKKLIYRIQAGEGEEALTLRYDLTMSFARFLANTGKEHFKRAQVGWVGRRDHPSMGKGRFRLFYQADFDIAGMKPNTLRMASDAECIQFVGEVLRDMHLGPFVVKVNHIGLLDAILKACDVDDKLRATTCSSIDKLDKIPWSVVAEELRAKGLVVAQITALEKLLKGKEEDFRKDPVVSIQGKQALDDLGLCFTFLRAFGGVVNAVLEPSLARGLGYYTGIIFEAQFINHPSFGSVAAGGRYDNLVSKFCSRSVPIVGASIGVDRILAIQESRAEEKEKETETVQVLVASIGKEPELTAARLDLLAKLWEANISAETFYEEGPKREAQLAYAIKKKITTVVWIGAKELKKLIYTIKFVSSKLTESVPKADVVTFLQKMFENL